MLCCYSYALDQLKHEIETSWKLKKKRYFQQLSSGVGIKGPGGHYRPLPPNISEGGPPIIRFKNDITYHDIIMHHMFAQSHTQSCACMLLALAYLPEHMNVIA